MRSRCAKATVRSPRHSSTITSSAPRLARSTAASSRSAAKPAPVPTRSMLGVLTTVDHSSKRPEKKQGWGFSQSVTLKGGNLREEQVVDGGRRFFERADLGHKLRRLENLLRLQSVSIVLVAYDLHDVVDAVLGVLGHVEVELRCGPLVPVDDLDGLAQGVVERLVSLGVGIPELGACCQEHGRGGSTKGFVVGGHEVSA